jgi:hypothetical protein
MDLLNEDMKESEFGKISKVSGPGTSALTDRAHSVSIANRWLLAVVIATDMHGAAMYEVVRTPPSAVPLCPRPPAAEHCRLSPRCVWARNR